MAAQLVVPQTLIDVLRVAQLPLKRLEDALKLILLRSCLRLIARYLRAIGWRLCLGVLCVDRPEVLFSLVTRDHAMIACHLWWPEELLIAA